MDDRSLALACANGDESAWRLLLERHGSLVYGVCERQLDADAAHDATQAVFLVFARKAKDAAKASSLAGWLIGTARNVVRNAQRECGRRRHREEEAAAMQHRQTNDTPEGDLVSHLDEIIAELPSHEREVIELQFLAGLSQREIALRLKIPTGTIAARSHRGLERLREGYRRRGVKVASTVLLALLVQAGAAEMPGETANAIRIQTPLALKTAGRPAPDPDGRISRWSKSKGVSAMTMTIAGGLLIGLAGTAYLVTNTGSKALPQPPEKPGVVSQEIPANPPQKATIATGTESATKPWTYDPSRLSGMTVTFSLPNLERTCERLEKSSLAALAPAFRTMQKAGTDKEFLRSIILSGNIENKPGFVFQDFGWGLGKMTPMTGQMPPSNEEGLAAIRQQLKGEMTEYRRQELQTTLMMMEGMQVGIQGKPLSGTMSLVIGVDHTQPATPVPANILQGVNPVLAKFGLSQISSKDSWTYFVPRKFFGLPIDGTPECSSWSHPSPQPKFLFVFSNRHTTNIDAKSWEIEDPQADLEFRTFVRHDQEKTYQAAGQLGLRIDQLGLRLDAWQPLPTTFTMKVEPVDTKIFAKVPSAALMAAAVRVTPEILKELLNNVSLQLKVNGEQSLKIGAVKFVQEDLNDLLHLADTIDGHLLAYVEPGLPIPSLTIALTGVQPQASEDLFAKCVASGLKRDGDVIRLPTMIPITLTKKNNVLILTTNPLGAEAFFAGGGFDKHADVQRSLAAIPAGPQLVVGVLRPEASLDVLTTYAGMLPGMTEVQNFLVDHKKRLSALPNRSWITTGPKGNQWHTQGEGLIAPIAVIGSLAAVIYVQSSVMSIN